MSLEVVKIFPMALSAAVSRAPSAAEAFREQVQAHTKAQEGRGPGHCGQVGFVA